MTKCKWKKSLSGMLLSMLMLSSTYADITPLKGMLVNGTTLVPIRTLSEAFGASVGYEPTTKQITVKTDQITTTMFPNNDLAMINDIPTKMTLAPQIIEGSTYVPLRFVGEAIGATIGYDLGVITATFNGEEKRFKLANSSDQVQNEVTTNDDAKKEEDLFAGYRVIEVDGGNLSGHREPNVAVNIGFGNRDYWAFTNEHGQLVRVVADQIILQDEENEPVLSTGRYYRDEAKVPGVESKTLDEGHVIADSLGGVANAYNITPQDSTLNRHGDQAYMESAIRKAGGATNFEAIITYPNTNTQIPSYYSYTYTINGNVIEDAFPNGDPDKANEQINQPPTTSTPPQISGNSDMIISHLDKYAEYITLKNNGSEAINLSGWRILSVTGGQDFIFGNYVLEAGATVVVGDSAKNTVNLHWMEGRGVWNNSSSDPAELYNASGALVSRYDD